MTPPETPFAVEIANLTKCYRREQEGRRWIPAGLTPRKRAKERREEAMIDIDIDDVDEEGIEDDERDEPERPSRTVMALRDITLAVPTGTALGIVGSNGSGKTTLMRILGRLTPPTEGTIVTYGRVAPLVPSLPGLMLPRESLRRNVVQVAQFYGIAKAEAVGRTEAIVDLAEMKALLDQPVYALSRGELQRFAFALALELDPATLIADDVITVGDRHYQQRGITHIQEQLSRGLTIVFASHQLEQVRRLCTRVVHLEEGEIVDDGPCEEVLGRYERGLKVARGSGGGDLGTDGVVGAGVFTAAGRPTEALHVEEAGLVEMVVDIVEAPAAVRCALSLKADDHWARATQPQPVDIEAPGRYVFSALIPAGALAPGSYRADVSAVDFSAVGRRSLGVRRHAFPLEVYDLDERLGEGKGDLTGGPGKSSLRLAWSVTRAAD